jgi:hypothetical protein
MTTTRSPILYRRATPIDFEGILRLQHQNLLTNLKGEELSQGFLSIEHTREQLHKITTEMDIFIAVQDKTVIGYLMTETVEFAVGSPLIAHMFKRLKDIIFENVPLLTSYLFVYGPVCIDRPYRGQGILEGLFEIMKGTIKADHDVGIAFVAHSNSRSLQAHTAKLGMRVIDAFEFGDGKYSTLAFKVK